MDMDILKILENRFKSNMHRHVNIAWEEVLSALLRNQDKLKTIEKMEETGGEPDVVALDQTNNIYIIDCSKETPKGRVGLCYDEEALHTRKQNKPKSSVEKQAKEMGVSLLTFTDYQNLQKVDSFDLKTSTWLETPTYIRKLGGALFGDRRYDTVFLYHNGAESYYSSRGFRGKIIL